MQPSVIVNKLRNRLMSKAILDAFRDLDFRVAAGTTRSTLSENNRYLVRDRRCHSSVFSAITPWTDTAPLTARRIRASTKLERERPGWRLALSRARKQSFDKVRCVWSRLRLPLIGILPPHPTPIRLLYHPQIGYARSPHTCVGNASCRQSSYRDASTHRRYRNAPPR